MATPHNYCRAIAPLVEQYCAKFGLLNSIFVRLYNFGCSAGVNSIQTEHTMHAGWSVRQPLCHLRCKANPSLGHALLLGENMPVKEFLGNMQV